MAMRRACFSSRKNRKGVYFGIAKDFLLKAMGQAMEYIRKTA